MEASPLFLNDSTLTSNHISTITSRKSYAFALAEYVREMINSQSVVGSWLFKMNGYSSRNKTTMTATTPTDGIGIDTRCEREPTARTEALQTPFRSRVIMCQTQCTGTLVSLNGLQGSNFLIFHASAKAVASPIGQIIGRI